MNYNMHDALRQHRHWETKVEAGLFGNAQAQIVQQEVLRINNLRHNPRSLFNGNIVVAKHSHHAPKGALREGAASSVSS